jgi:ABC-type glycerol-3-phosphate transport system substrate-binding protein
MKTTNRTVRRSIAVLAGLSLVAAACGSDDAPAAAPDNEPAATDQPADETAEEVADETAEEVADDPAEEPAAAGIISDECPIPAPADAVTIDLMGWEFPVTKVITDELQECDSDNISINVQLLDNASAQDQITLDFSTGSPQFEIVHATDSLVGLWADDLTDLTPFIDKYRDEFALDDIPQAMWDGATVDGKVLGVPLFSNTMHFFYNKDILDANGLTPPDNYDELIDACGVLKGAGFDDPFNMNLSANWAWEIEFFNILGTLQPGDIINEDNTPAFNTEEGIAAASKIVEISDACMSDAGRAFGIDDAEAALRSGELPMAEIWASRAAQMDDPENSLVVDKIGFGPALRTNADTIRTGPAFVDYYAIPAGGDVDPETVFLTLMAAIDVESQDAAAAFAAVARLGATNPDAPRNAEASAISVAEGVGSRTKSAGLPLAQGFLGDALLEITSNGADPATALAEAEATYLKEAATAGFL